MRVKTLTLSTAAAAALTIGLASPALSAAPSVGQNQAMYAVGWQHGGVQHQALLSRADDDDDDDDSGDDGGPDNEIVSGGFHRSIHCGGFGRCGRGFLRPFAHRFGCLHRFCGGFGGFGGGGGEAVAAEEAGRVGVVKERPRRPRRPMVPPVMRPPVRIVPKGPVKAGFGGSHGASAPLGIAGLTMLLTGAGLIPVARRRRQASVHS